MLWVVRRQCQANDSTKIRGFFFNSQGENRRKEKKKKSVRKMPCNRFWGWRRAQHQEQATVTPGATLSGQTEGTSYFNVLLVYISTSPDVCKQQLYIYIFSSLVCYATCDTICVSVCAGEMTEGCSKKLTVIPLLHVCNGLMDTSKDLPITQGY